MPLGEKFFFNIFLNSDFSLTLENLILLSYQQFVDFFLLNFHSILSVLLLFSIYIGLFLNMFHYSIRYYITNLLFSFQRNPFIFKRDFVVSKNKVVFGFLTRGNYTNKYVPAYQAADTMFLLMVFLFFSLTYNVFLYQNCHYLFIDSSSLTTVINFNLVKWISYFQDSIHFGFLLDSLSWLMLVVVLSISTLVHYYSIDYMSSDPRLLTFMKYLSGFTLAMVLLVTANNFALLFLGWEGVGIFSYLLIGFWYTRTLALKAALKAVIVNRIGDAALIIASGLILHFFGTLEFKKLQILILYLFDFKIASMTLTIFNFEISIISLICFFLLIAAVGKSAQFGLHTWLPDAMEGPTPVSALIHAATMVTAGVYLIVRTSFFFEYSDTVRNMTLVIGAFTALFGSVTACYQFDIKRIIAFSTCSQLGYMFLACGLSAYNLAMFHLFIHAFFKALLFLCAGSVIHSIGDEQDIRKMGNLYIYMPITYTGLCIGFFSLAGLPFTSGFFSKDTIIELAMCKRDAFGAYAYICAVWGACCTAFYTVWFFNFVIFSEGYLSWTVLANVWEHGNNMLSVIMILTLVTIFVGACTKNPLTSPMSFLLFSDSIFVKNYNFYFNFYEDFLFFYRNVHQYVFNYMKIILFLIPPFAIYISVVTYWYKDLYNTYDLIDGYETTVIYIEPRRDRRGYCHYDIVGEWFCHWISLKKFFETKGATDQLYNQYIVFPLLNFSYSISYKELDRGWLEFFFVKVPTLICFFFAKIFNQNFGSLKLNFLPALVYIIVILLYIYIIYF